MKEIKGGFRAMTLSLSFRSDDGGTNTPDAAPNTTLSITSIHSLSSQSSSQFSHSVKQADIDIEQISRLLFDSSFLFFGNLGLGGAGAVAGDVAGKEVCQQEVVGGQEEGGRKDNDQDVI
jgi:hypothetical protein